MTDENLVRWLREAISNLQAVYLFGSAATGELRPDSDLDIAVLADAPIDPVARFDLAQAIAAARNRDVDLIDLASASAVLRVEIVGRGRRLFPTQDEAVEQFEDFVFSDYARLNEERHAILEDVYSRGSVHGR